MKLKLILFQSVLRFRLLATILHPPIGSAASSPTSRLDGEAKNALIVEAFKFILSIECHGTDGPDDDSDDDAPARMAMRTMTRTTPGLPETTHSQQQS